MTIRSQKSDKTGYDNKKKKWKMYILINENMLYLRPIEKANNA